MNSNLLFDQFTNNIQEIIDIDWLGCFNLFACFFVFLSSLQMIRKRGNNSKTGESSTLLLCHSKIHVPILYQLTAICPIRHLGERL